MHAATETESNVDYAVQATSALAAVERLTADLDTVAAKVTQCREKWRDYGAALLAQRTIMPSNKQFGEWVTAHRLDSGLAAHHQVRSDAMWLAEHYDIVRASDNVTGYNPQAIRQQCRAAGYEWAHETPLQKQRKQDSVRAKRPYSWQRVAADEGFDVSHSGGVRTTIRAQLAAIDATPDLLTAPNEHRLRAALVQLRAQQQPETAAAVIAEARATVPESARVRFDKAIARATAAIEGVFTAKEKALQNSYERAVAAGIEQRLAVELAAERKQLVEAIERNRRERNDFINRRDGIKLVIDRDEWRRVLNCLHSDRAPDDRKKKFDDAFEIIKRLGPYVGEV